MTAGELIDPPPQDQHSRAAVLEQADKTGLDKLSEVTIYAIPLFHQGDLVQLVYLPVPTKELPTDSSKSRVPQKLRDYAQKTQVGQHTALFAVLLPRTGKVIDMSSRSTAFQLHWQ